MNATCTRRRIVLVTGLSGAGKNSILRALEDLGYETIDNLPLALIAGIAARDARSLAVGVDARTRDFTAAALIQMLAELRSNPTLHPELVFATASVEALQRRYTESRRRHPMAPTGRVVDGIAAEQTLLAGLRDAADLVVETTDLPTPSLRRLIETRFGQEAGAAGLTVSLISFAFPAGVPREADLVFDARFLRNPHYVTDLRPLTGLAPEIAAYVEADPDFNAFFSKISDLLQFLLPRFVQEGKRYVTICIGCTGGRHRSVHVVERLAAQLAQSGWRVTRAHRELSNDDFPPLHPISSISSIHTSRADAPAPSGTGDAVPEAQHVP
jgi:UPF0042 nucleotide-binding protein